MKKGQTVRTENSCPLCGDRRLLLRWIGPDLHFDTPGEFAMGRCFSCDLSRLYEPPGQNAAPLYPDEYSPYEDERPIAQVSKQRPSHRLREWRRRWYALGRPSLFNVPLPSFMPLLAAKLFSLSNAYRFNPFSFMGQGAKVLDVGCANGHFLSEMKALGWNTYGIEANEQAAQKAQSRGHRVLAASMTSGDEFIRQEGPFDLIVFRQSLEHLDDPFSALRQALSALAPGGFCAIWTPVTDSLFASLYGQFWYNLDLPRHRVLFSRKTLSAMIRQAGLEPVFSAGMTSTKSITESRRLRNAEKPNGRRKGASGLLAAMFVKLLDLLQLGDNVVMIAKKPDAERLDR